MKNIENEIRPVNRLYLVLIMMIVWGFGLSFVQAQEIQSMYNQHSMDDLKQAVMHRQAIFDNNRNKINDLVDWIYKLKSQTNDTEFLNILDNYQKKLIALKGGDLSVLGDEIKKIEWEINDEILKHNSKQSTSSNSSSTITENKFNTGDHVMTSTDSPVRDNPNVNANELFRTSSNQIVKILYNVNGVFYAIEIDGKQGFISRNFLLEKVNQPENQNFNNHDSQTQNNDEDQLIYQSAIDAYKLGDFPTARKNIDKLLTKNNDPELHYFRGLTLWGDKKYNEAIADIDQSISSNPNDPRYYFARGNLLYQMNDLVKSLIDLTKGLKLYPYNTDAYFLKGLIKSKLGDNHGAISDYDSILKFHSDTIRHNYDLATVYNNKAYCLITLGDYKSSLPLVNKALNLDQSHAYIWETRGELNFRVGKFQECINDMSKAISIEKNNNSLFYYYSGLSKIKLKISGGCEDLSKAGEQGMVEAYDTIKKYCNK